MTIEELANEVLQLKAALQYQIAYADAERQALRSLLDDEQLQDFFRTRETMLEKYRTQKQRIDRCRGLD